MEKKSKNHNTPEENVSATNSPPNNEEPMPSQLETQSPAKTMESISTPTDGPTPTQTQRPAAPPNTSPALTIGQADALKSAQSYLELYHFSYERLIEQLEYEKYSREDALYTQQITAGQIGTNKP